MVRLLVSLQTLQTHDLIRPGREPSTSPSASAEHLAATAQTSSPCMDLYGSYGSMLVPSCCQFPWFHGSFPSPWHGSRLSLISFFSRNAPLSHQHNSTSCAVGPALLLFCASSPRSDSTPYSIHACAHLSPVMYGEKSWDPAAALCTNARQLCTIPTREHNSLHTACISGASTSTSLYLCQDGVW